jgi:hypothetical protein
VTLALLTCLNIINKWERPLPTPSTRSVRRMTSSYAIWLIRWRSTFDNTESCPSLKRSTKRRRKRWKKSRHGSPLLISNRVLVICVCLPTSEGSTTPALVSRSGLVLRQVRSTSFQWQRLCRTHPLPLCCGEHALRPENHSQIAWLPSLTRLVATRPVQQHTHPVHGFVHHGH